MAVKADSASSYTSPEARERIDARRLQKRLEKANVPSKYFGWGWGDLEPYEPTPVSATEFMQNWVSGFADGKVVEEDGRGVILYGAPGHGKTALVSVALQEALRASQPSSWGKRWTRRTQPARGAYMAPYRHFPTLTQRQFNDGTTEEDDKLLLDIRGGRQVGTAIRLLVLDDVGKEHRTGSGWASGFFEDLIRTRAYEGWPTVITTNLRPSEWKSAYGDSCESFMHEAFFHVRVESPVGDRRQS